MIMRAGQPLLLPVSPAFIWTSLTLAFLFNLLPLGRLVWMPDALAVVLVFWNVHDAPTRSILLIKQIRGTLYLSAWPH